MQKVVKLIIVINISYIKKILFVTFIRTSGRVDLSSQVHCVSEKSSLLFLNSYSLGALNDLKNICLNHMCSKISLSKLSNALKSIFMFCLFFFAILTFHSVYVSPIYRYMYRESNSYNANQFALPSVRSYVHMHSYINKLKLAEMKFKCGYNITMIFIVKKCKDSILQFVCETAENFWIHLPFRNVIVKESYYLYKFKQFYKCLNLLELISISKIEQIQRAHYENNNFMRKKINIYFIVRLRILENLPSMTQKNNAAKLIPWNRQHNSIYIFIVLILLIF